MDSEDADIKQEQEYTLQPNSPMSAKDDEFVMDYAVEVVMKLRTGEFIGEVQKHPVLWNPDTEGYNDPAERFKAWVEVVKAQLYPDIDERPYRDKNEIAGIVQRKWKNIRTCYSREIARRKTAGTTGKRHKEYIYFKQLNFLGTVAREETCSNTDVSYSNDYTKQEKPTRSAREAKNKPERAEPTDTRPVLKRTSEENDDRLMATVPKQIAYTVSTPEENDEDMLFFRSLLSEVKKVPESKKLKLRADIITLIANAQSLAQPMWPVMMPQDCYLTQENSVYLQPQTYANNLQVTQVRSQRKQRKRRKTDPLSTVPYTEANTSGSDS